MDKGVVSFPVSDEARQTSDSFGLWQGVHAEWSKGSLDAVESTPRSASRPAKEAGRTIRLVIRSRHGHPS